MGVKTVMLATFGMLSSSSLIIVLVIALVIFGPGKLPELGKALGKSINEFKTATNVEESTTTVTNLPGKNENA